MSEFIIPDDLKETYSQCFDDEHHGLLDKVLIRGLIERIAVLGQSLIAERQAVGGWIQANGRGGWIEGLRKENEILKAPISDEELKWGAATCPEGGEHMSVRINRILTHRRDPKVAQKLIN